jgi:hypothetical protein
MSPGTDLDRIRHRVDDRVSVSPSSRNLFFFRGAAGSRCAGFRGAVRRGLVLAVWMVIGKVNGTAG